MYSPKELEGEVDHSFFDSDCDVSSTKPENPVHHDKVDRDSTNKMLPDQTERRRKQQGSEVETLAKEMFGLEVQSGLIVKDDSKYKEETEIIKVKNVDAERDEVPCGKKNSDSSSRKSSPLPRSDMSDSSRGSQSDDSSSICSSSSSAAEEDDTVSVNTDNASYRRKNCKNPSGKFFNRSHSYSSASSGEERSPTPLTKPSSTPSTSSSRRQPQPRSVNRKQRPKTSEMPDSDDTVTDVTPLSSPDVSLQQSVKLALPTFSQSSLPVDGQQLNATTNGKKRSVKKAARRTSIPSPGSASVSSSRSSASCSRKNYSFTSEEVRRIEYENQRLLHVLSRSSTGSSSRSTHQSSTQTFRLYHSTLNRQREHERIQRENLALLKRLESIKASPGMTRLEQLTDYHRQAGYLGSPLIRPTSGKSSKICGSTSPQRTRPETAKPTRNTTPRPAWS